MLPMPPGGMPGAPLGCGLSATIASVVINSPATEAASCSATRTTLVGSPALTFLVYWQFFVRSGKAVLHPVACDQVRGARGRGQGTETVAQLGGLPLSVACVSQRLEA
jgi:hypothetical protein